MKRKETSVRTKTADPYLIYGLSYKTIHEDSKYYDDHEEWFESEDKRDSVFIDWAEGKYWDKENNCELEYRTPRPNYNHSLTRKISKFSQFEDTISVSYSITEEEYIAINKAIDDGNFEVLKGIFSADTLKIK